MADPAAETAALRKQWEQEAAQRKQLEATLQHREEQLKAASRQLKELGELKSGFVAQMSHELRTPLAIIREGISQVLDGICGQANEKQRGTLSIVLRNIDRLGRLIEDLLDISRIETGKLGVWKEPFDLVDLVQEVSRAFLPKAQEKGLEMKARFPRQKVQVHADREKIFQIFSNLLANAVKFTQKGSIEICIEDSAEAVACSVSDTGPGIAQENIPRLFNKFEQLHESTGATGERGTGLGLAICKGIVDLHGGKIWVESTLPQGARFIFTLPKMKEGMLRAA